MDRVADLASEIARGKSEESPMRYYVVLRIVEFWVV
jgi:hypothetical protein